MVKKSILLVVLVLFIGSCTYAQRSKRRSLEARRTQLKKDIRYFNTLISKTQKKEKNLLGEIRDLNYKIKRRNSLISTIKEESEELEKEILSNEEEIKSQQLLLEELKQDYAKIVYNSYKSKSKNKQLLFVLSSDDFVQAYKRFQYIKQYTHFRKKQADKIQAKTNQISVMIDSLSHKKESKSSLLTEKEKEQKTILKEKKKHESLLKKAKSKKQKYVRQLAKSQQEEKRINNLINRLIREAITHSNRKSKNKKSRGFRMTAEGKKLASKFYLNKGKLPWPVKKGFVSTYYGRQPHPLVKTATLESHGVRITTSKGSRARSVFDGKVLAIQVLVGNKKAVLIKHGNYVTVYKNLEKIFVKKGQKVKTKQEIGTIFTDKITGKTILGFLLTRDTKTQNPASWIYRM